LNALDIWNKRLAEIWSILLQSPENFKGGGIWNVMVSINGALKGVGFALLVLFFLTGVVKTCGSFTELKKPEVAVKLFVRFVLAKAVVTYGLELMMALFSIVQGVITTTMDVAGIGAQAGLTVPNDVVVAVMDLKFGENIGPWIISFCGMCIIIVISFIILISVYQRFFRLYIYTALAPVPLSSFAGEPTQNMGKSFLKSYAAVCLEGAIIVIACIIFSAFATSPPAVDPSAAPDTVVLYYCVEVILNMLVLVGTVKAADRAVHDMLGL
jgi:hypothetical protein